MEDHTDLDIDFGPLFGPEGNDLVEQARKRALELRRAGDSYEDVAKAVSDDSMLCTPWGVYSWCHPHKSAEQVDAWRRKHHPSSVAHRHPGR
jgi:hypothetical protein